MGTQGEETQNLNNFPLWRHSLEQHGGEVQRYLMSVTGTNKNDAMLRQINKQYGGK